MNPRFAGALGVMAAALAAAGCADLGVRPPHAALRDAGSLAAQRSLAGAPVSPAAWPAEDWWHAFGDPQLDQLITEALAGSPTLKVAEARTRAALALADAGKAVLYPQVNAGARAAHQRFPGHGLVPPPAAGSWGTVYQLDATLSWELDFWGKNRAAYDGALGRARAAEVDAHAARLALTSEVALAYAQLERAYLELDVATTSLEDRQKIYDLTRERNAAGLDSALELRQAEAALPAMRERIEQLHEAIGLTRHQIAALLGQGPDRGLAIERPAARGLASLALPSKLPAELLGRRPDLVARRWRVEAAGRDIAAAKAQFYPNIDLVGLIGLQSLGSAGFLTAASRTVAAGPALTLPVFDAGRLRANLAGKDADYDVAVEQYNQALADALRDVADQLTALRSVQAQRTEQAQAIAATREAYDLAVLRYREGIGNYLQVLSAEAPLLEQRRLDADLHARELAVSINLVRALGGGFRPQPVASADARATTPGESRHE